MAPVQMDCRHLAVAALFDVFVFHSSFLIAFVLRFIPKSSGLTIFPDFNKYDMLVTLIHMCCLKTKTLQDTLHVYVDDAGRDDIDVVKVVDALAAQQMQLPLILRFPDILRHRMQELQACFSAAMSKFDYQVGLSSFFSSPCPSQYHSYNSCGSVGQVYR